MKCLCESSYPFEFPVSAPSESDCTAQVCGTAIKTQHGLCLTCILYKQNSTFSQKTKIYIHLKEDRTLEPELLYDFLIDTVYQLP